MLLSSLSCISSSSSCFFLFFFPLFVWRHQSFGQVSALLLRPVALNGEEAEPFWREKESVDDCCRPKRSMRCAMTREKSPVINRHDLLKRSVGLEWTRPGAEPMMACARSSTTKPVPPTCSETKVEPDARTSSERENRARLGSLSSSQSATPEDAV